MALIAVLAFALVAATPAEAAWTSEKEGRKYSRKWLNSVGGRYATIDFDQRRCWRISARGAGPYGILPRGVVCQFSGLQRRRGRPGICWIVSGAVKDKRRYFRTAEAQRPFPADLGYCRREAGAEKPPPPIGSRGRPL
jgi:hypothetical protein